MQDRPQLFDEALLARRRDRAVALGYAEGADFLIRRVADEVADRLAYVTRDFAEVALFGTGFGVMQAALPAGAKVQAFDPSPAMATALGAEVLGSDVLPVGEGTVDLAVSALLLHWANDPVGQLVQMRRALRPDGLLIAALFGGQTLSELRAALSEAEVEITGNLSARVAPMADLRDLGALLQRAGFAMPVADSDRVSVTYASPLALMRELRAMGESSILLGRRPLRRDVLARACQLYEQHFPAPTPAPDGRVTATFEIVTLTGWAPGPDQPVAKRPGSATTRLAEALGTVEQPAGEKAPKA